MATQIDGDEATNGYHLRPDIHRDLRRSADVASYLSEALKLTLGATQEELGKEGGPLAQSEVDSTVGRFQTFLSGARTAFYAQKVEAASQQDGTTELPNLQVFTSRLIFALSTTFINDFLILLQSQSYYPKPLCGSVHQKTCSN